MSICPLSESWFLEVDQSINSAYQHFSLEDQQLIDTFCKTQSQARSKEIGLNSKIPVLHINTEGVFAKISDLKNEFRLSFEQGEMARRMAQASETLCRVTGASRGKIMTIHDATAGLCRESILMASCGAKVSASERSLALYLLAKDALNRSNIPIDLLKKNSLDHQVQAHVVYLDPMFPKSKKKAAVGKEAVVLRAFAEQSMDQEENLLEWALDSAICRVVVKRPIKAEYLAQKAPTSSVKGKAIRFDIYGKQKLPKA